LFRSYSVISDDDLIRRQDALQAEAREVLEQLRLFELLGRVGRPVIVGSTALGLMVWRDVDVEVYCPALSPDGVFEAVRPLASVPGIHKLNFRDWSGPRSTPDVPDGLYWGVRYQPQGSEEWKFDLWFVAENTTHRMGSELLRSLPPRLTPEVRATILQLKSLWFDHPSYRHGIYSIDVYDAVLEHGISTAEQFERYLRERGKLL
jgi:hypothetical protein